MKRMYYFLAVILIVFVVYFLVIYYVFSGWQERGTFGDMFGALNALFSALALAGVIYTLNLQRRDSELLIKPLLAVEPIENKGGKYKLLVTNIGNGTALNIDFEPLLLGPNTPVVFKAQRIISLKAGDSKELEIESYLGDELSDHSWTAHLKKEYANRVMTVTIIYGDIEFKEMKQSFELGLGDLKVTMTKYK